MAKFKKKEILKAIIPLMEDQKQKHDNIVRGFDDFDQLKNIEYAKFDGMREIIETIRNLKHKTPKY